MGIRAKGFWVEVATCARPELEVFKTEFKALSLDLSKESKGETQKEMISDH